MPFRVVGYNKVIDDSSLAALKQSVLDLVQWTTYEFQQVASAMLSTEADKTWNAAPPKPRAGTMAYADGTHWNPGSGEGFYEYTSVGWIPMFVNANTLATRVATIKSQRFTASGTYTPSAGLLYCVVECVGGGGAGGGAVGATNFVLGGGGGGSGGYTRRIANAAGVGSSQTITIGTAGAAGTGTGGNGGLTTVGTLCQANGGTGGIGGTSANFGYGQPGGAAAGAGDLALQGNPGAHGPFLNGTFAAASAMGGGNGGNSFFGTGGLGGANASGNAGQFGGGGGGGSTNAASSVNGGAGGPGLVFITEFCNQ